MAVEMRLSKEAPWKGKKTKDKTTGESRDAPLVPSTQLVYRCSLASNNNKAATHLAREEILVHVA